MRQRARNPQRSACGRWCRRPGLPGGDARRPRSHALLPTDPRPRRGAGVAASVSGPATRATATACGWWSPRATEPVGQVAFYADPRRRRPPRGRLPRSTGRHQERGYATRRRAPCGTTRSRSSGCDVRGRRSSARRTTPPRGSRWKLGMEPTRMIPGARASTTSCSAWTGSPSRPDRVRRRDDRKRFGLYTVQRIARA